MLEDIRKGDAKCIDCHTGEKIHPRAFAHGGNGRGPVADAGAPQKEVQR
jgi:cytochrome c-type protein NapC